jgi:hypothetical protein
MDNFENDSLPGDDRWASGPLASIEPEPAAVSARLAGPQTEQTQDPPKKKRRGSLGRLWANTIGRALTGAVDEAADTVVNVGADVRMAAERGLFKLTKGGHQIDEDFLSWYEAGAENRNPFKFGNKREEWFGQKDKDSIGWAEDILQFAAGLYASTKLLSGAKAGTVVVAGSRAAQGAKHARLLGRIGRIDKAGLVADAAFMDPDENNILDIIIKKAPDEQATLIQRAFASDPDDSETWNRVKAGLNGFIVGKALDRTVAVLRYNALSRKAAKLSQGPEREALQARAVAALEEAEKVATPAHTNGKKAADSVDVMPDPQGEGFVLSRNGTALEDSPAFARESLAHAHAAAINEALPRASDELLFTAKLIKENVLNAARNGDPVDAARLMRGVHFNFHYLGNTEGQRAWLTAVEEAISESLSLPTITNKELEQAAVRLELGPPSAIRAALDNRASQVRGAMVEQLAARAYLSQATQYVSNLALIVERENMGNAINLEKLRVSLGSVAEVLPGIRNLSNASGQLLQSHQITVPLAYADNAANHLDSVRLTDGAAEVAAKGNGVGRRAPAGAGAFAGMTEREVLGMARRVAMAQGDEKTLTKLLSVEAEAVAAGVKKGSKGYEWFNRLRYNSLLSGPRTHSRNLFSNTIQALWRPIELGLSGVYAGDTAQVTESFDMMAGLWRHKWEGFTTFGQAFRTGAPVLDSEALQESVKALTEAGEGAGQTYRMFGMELTRRSDSWLKEVLDVPSRFLMSADEYFKTLNYRAAINADAMRNARSVFPNEPAKWAQYADEYIENAFDSRGGYISEQAMEYAREGTFTRQLADGGWASRLSTAIQGTPLKIVVPFVQTPINVFISVTERTPALWRLSKRMKADLEAGGRAAALAQAKIQMGQDLWTLAAGLALAGHITGGGPKDPRLRNQQLTSGWRPYSVKVPGTDKWLSYAGVEPLGTIIGIAADVLESASDLHRDEREQDLLEVASAFSIGVANNVTNKTFLRGLADFSSLLAGSESAGERWVASLAGSMIPFGSAINQLTTDETVREARSIADRIVARTAFGNVALEPMRNVFGRPVMKESWAERAFLPFSLSDASDQLEERVMRKLLLDTGGAEFLLVPQGRYHDLDLKDRVTFNDRPGQSPYDRLLELFDSGELRALDGGVVNDTGKLPPLVEGLRAMVEEDEAALLRYFGPLWFKFAGWTDARISEGRDISKLDTRKAMADEMIRLYKEASLARIEAEYPTLAKAVQEVRSGKLEAKIKRADRFIDVLNSGPSTK